MRSGPRWEACLAPSWRIPRRWEARPSPSRRVPPWCEARTRASPPSGASSARAKEAARAAPARGGMGQHAPPRASTHAWESASAPSPAIPPRAAARALRSRWRVARPARISDGISGRNHSTPRAAARRRSARRGRRFFDRSSLTLPPRQIKRAHGLHGVPNHASSFIHIPARLRSDAGHPVDTHVEHARCARGPTRGGIAGPTNLSPAVSTPRRLQPVQLPHGGRDAQHVQSPLPLRCHR